MHRRHSRCLAPRRCMPFARKVSPARADGDAHPPHDVRAPGLRSDGGEVRPVLVLDAQDCKSALLRAQQEWSQEQILPVRSVRAFCSPFGWFTRSEMIHMWKWIHPADCSNCLVRTVCVHHPGGAPSVIQQPWLFFCLLSSRRSSRTPGSPGCKIRLGTKALWIY